MEVLQSADFLAPAVKAGRKLASNGDQVCTPGELTAHRRLYKPLSLVPCVC